VGRSDESQYACGIAMFQIAIIDGKRVRQFIGIASHKFSKQAFKWDIHKNEAYAMFLLLAYKTTKRLVFSDGEYLCKVLCLTGTTNTGKKDKNGRLFV
jgi:hypothetical protein